MSAHVAPSGDATARRAARLAWTGGAPQWTKTAWSADSGFLALSGSPAQVLARSWDPTNGGRAFVSADAGSTWTQIGSADGEMDILALALVEGGMLAGTWNGLYLSTNGGASWIALAPTGLPADTAIWSLATVGSTVFAGTTGHVYKSTDGGASFVDASTGIPATAIVRSFVAAGSTVFATTNSDGIFATTNGAASWAARNSGLTDTRVSQVVVSGGKTFAVTLGGLFVSSNGGTTWVADASGIEQVNCLLAANDELLAGTDADGVFSSTDGGVTWAAAGAGMTAGARVWSLAVTNNDVFAATDAGIWRASMVPNAAPTVVTPAVASPNPVAGTTTAVSVLGADDGGEPSLTYTWAVVGTPPAAVAFAANGTNAAKSTTATFAAAGTYTLVVTVRDLPGLTAASQVVVVVEQTLASLLVTPASASVVPLGAQQFVASARDQFGADLATQPPVTWSVSAGGTIDGSGLFTAGESLGGPFTVTAASGAATGVATVEVAIPNTAPAIATPAAADPSPVTGTTATLSVLAVDDAGEASLTYTWATTGTPPAPVSFSANASNAAKTTTATFTKAGSYTFRVTVTDQPGATVESSVTVTIGQTLTTIAVSPASATVNAQATQQFTASARDQFGTNLATQPTFAWTATGGTIASSGLFTASAAAGTYTVTATAAGLSGMAAVTVSSAPVVVYQINSGGSAASPYGADQYASGGTKRTVTNAITISGITNPAPRAVYQAERYGTITYTLPNLTAGSQYTVRLHFAELYWTATGKRRFNVVINGATVLSSFDIYAAVGARYKALVREFTTTANASGQIVINFQTVTDNATIEGIEVISATPNGAPTIATAAAASPNPVTGTTASLSALGADDGGEAGLTYTWTTLGTPPAAVTFSANGTNAAKATTATFSKAGSYTLQVTVKDQPGLTATSTVAVTVDQTLTSIAVAPSSASLAPLGTQQFTATARDQFATALTTQPTFTWTASGGGTISSGGLFTAGSTAGGPYTVTAANSAISGTATVTVATVNTAPTIATAAAATPSPVVGTATALSVLGADDGGEPALTYTWATTGTPPAAVTFSANGNNAAKNTTATFSKAGSYTFQATVKDAGNLTATSQVTVTVNQTLTSIVVSPSSATVNASATQQFTATARDQFATTLGTQPTFAWTTSGGGTISSGGLFTAGSTAGGPYTVTATSGAVAGTATVTVAAVNTAPTIATAAAATPSPVTGTTTALSVLGADDGGEPALTYTWATTGTPPAAVTFSANGSNAAKSTTATFTKAGSYTFQATVKDAGNLTATSQVTVTVSQTLTSVVVSPTSATVTAGATQQFTATARDQFATNLGTPPTFTWTVSGGGTISSGGLFTAGSTAGGPYTVTAASGGKSGTAGVTVSSASTNPCDGLCTSPVVFTSSNYQSGNLGTGATCHQTTANLMGGNCSNISARTLKVNNTTMSCSNWTLPAKRNGGYCIQVTAGTPSYTSFATW